MFLLLFFIIDVYYSIPGVITQIFNPTAVLVISLGVSTKETKSEIETHPVTAETKIKKSSI